VRSAEVSDHASNARAEFQTRVDAASLAQAAEGLLRLISELKVAAIVQDGPSSAREAAEVRAGLEAGAKSVGVELAGLRDDVAQLLSIVEDHYYESVCRVPAAFGSK
jgi:hypothetical protein